jgi:hypothetical protein
VKKVVATDRNGDLKQKEEKRRVKIDGGNFEDMVRESGRKRKTNSGKMEKRRKKENKLKSGKTKKLRG